MRFTKPAWVQHKEGSSRGNIGGDGSGDGKRQSIFSIHVHPDGSRIATGGLDAKIRIWSTRPILDEVADANNRPPKALCTLSMHTGPVLTVRWAHSGRWLASGSDDEIVMIWDLDPNGRGKIWGTNEVNIEGWKPLKRLPGHESDVTDVAWSPGDRYLASVGLDSQAIVWCGYTLERLRKLDQHQGFVKGVCWDPVGEYLATQSDDRSVKIWRTTDWSLEAEVTKPFEDSPGSTFFRRLSWSPDGAHITASNATNNKGFVFIAAVITRNSWTSEISLVGHENTVEVAAYNPHIFLRDPKQPVATANICSVVALGADDRSVSVWQTKSARPLIVAKEVFERQIMDLSWSWDGMTLYAASSDGTIAVFHFDSKELDGIAPHSVQEQYLSKFNFVPPPLPEGFSHTSRGLDPGSAHSLAEAAQQQQQSASPQVQEPQGEKINVLVAKKKKRVTLDGPGASASTPGARPPASAVASSSANGTNGILKHQVPPSSASMSAGFFPVPDEQPFAERPPVSRKGKEVDFSGRFGGDADGRPPPLSRSWSGGGDVLPRMKLQPNVKVKAVDSDDVLEAVNAQGSDPTELMYNSKGKVSWVDYLPSPVLALKATRTYCTAALLDGNLVVYSKVGRRLLPSMALGSPVAHLDGSGNTLSIVTASGQLYSWQVPRQTAIFPPVSIQPLIDGSPPDMRIKEIVVEENGCPIVHCSTGTMYSYDSRLATWVKLAERWWAEGSDVWRPRATTNAGRTSSIVTWVESHVDGKVDPTKSRPDWWGTALTLGHLETRMQASKLLDSPQDYKQALLLYAKKIADGGFKTKAEELVNDLFGDPLWRPSLPPPDDWSPTVVGLWKRDLLKDVVLAQLVRSKALSKMATDWQDVLKTMASQDA